MIGCSIQRAILRRAFETGRGTTLPSEDHFDDRLSGHKSPAVHGFRWVALSISCSLALVVTMLHVSGGGAAEEGALTSLWNNQAVAAVRPGEGKPGTAG